MSTPPPWGLRAERTLLDVPILRVLEVEAVSPRTGEPHAFYRVEAPDWVNVVAVTPSDDLVMVRQWRHGARRLTLEIPGGLVDAGETALEAAGRELLEETGHVADTLVPIGVVNPNPAIFANRCHTVLATGARRVADPTPDGHEETSVVLVARAELPRRLAAGEIDHALVLAALHWHALHLADR